VWILVTIAVATPINGHHLHSMGKLMFAFNCFWAYTAFCQFMLIWIADIPDETQWHHMRIWSDWRYVGYIQVVFHFVLPFIILLSRGLKFDKRKLGFMAVWLLVAHAIDTYWIVLPQISPEGPHFALSDLFAFVGVGGIAIGYLVFRMRGKNLVAIGDPFLPVSLEYRP
jgi:Ni/Fe-hydrogenase subunit HybB-like protein